MTPGTSLAADFRRGLLEPSLLSAGTALLVCAGLTAGALLTVDESFAASPDFQYFAPPRGAHAIAITSHLLRLEREQPRAPQVLVLGSSAVRNAVDVERLQERLRREVSADIDVLGLCTGAQPLPLARGMLERVPASTRGIVVLGVGMRQLASRAGAAADLGSLPRLGVRSDAVDAAVRASGHQPPSRIGVYAWDNRNFVVPRVFEGLIPNLLSGPGVPLPMPHAGTAPHPRGHFDRMLEAMLDSVAGYTENAARCATDLEAIVDDVARRPELDLVLLESALNPEFVARFSLEAEHAHYQELLGEIAGRHGVPLLHLDRAAGLVADDFRDAAHLRKLEAIRRYTDLLGDRLVEHLSGEGE